MKQSSTQTSKNRLDGNSYYLPPYLDVLRMSSYGYQYSLSLKSRGYSFLNVGSGNDLLSHLLAKQGKFVVDFDLNYSTNPTVNGILPSLPFSSSSFDVVLCFQMLEHLHFSLFSTFMKEFVRIGTKFVIISLPDITLQGYDKLKHYTYRIFGHPQSWKKYQKREINLEHEWEIGAGKVNEEMVLNSIDTKELFLERHFRNELYLYHHFSIWKILPKIGNK